MSVDVSKAIIHRYLREVFGQGKLALNDELVALNRVSNGPGALPGMLSGPEGVKMLIKNYRKEFPGLQDVIDESTAERNTVITRWTVSGT